MTTNPNIEAAANIMARRMMSPAGDLPTALATALDEQGLLVRLPAPDPEHAHVLRRSRALERMIAARRAVQRAGTHPTALENEAAAWEERCLAARNLAARMHADYAARPEVAGIQAYRDTVQVWLTDTATVDDWRLWISAVGAESHTVADRHGWCGATGECYGIPVWVTGPGHPEVVQQAAEAAAEQERQPATTYETGGQVYHLGLPLLDAAGHVWRFSGRFAPLGEPLLWREDDVQRSQCTLPGVLAHAGPLSPVIGEPEPEPLTPHNAARYLREMPGVVRVEILGGDTVGVHVEPRTHVEWTEWCTRLSAGDGMWSGGSVIAQGVFGGVPLRLTGTPAVDDSLRPAGGKR